MIYILIIFMILFVAALAWAAILNSENQDLKDQIPVSIIKDGRLLSAKDWQREAMQELERYSITVFELQDELSQLKSPKANEEQPEQGTFVKQRKLPAATPGTYRNVFDLDINGQRVLEHLTQVFCRDAYADTERETCHRLGQQSVINFILNNVNRANNPDYEESDND